MPGYGDSVNDYTEASLEQEEAELIRIRDQSNARTIERKLRELERDLAARQKRTAQMATETIAIPNRTEKLQAWYDGRAQGQYDALEMLRNMILGIESTGLLDTEDK